MESLSELCKESWGGKGMGTKAGQDHGHLFLLPPHGPALLKQQQVEDASGQREAVAFQKILTLRIPTLCCDIMTLSKGLDFSTGSIFFSL